MILFSGLYTFSAKLSREFMHDEALPFANKAVNVHRAVHQAQGMNKANINTL
jgi:hypothetical protein